MIKITIFSAVLACVYAAPGLYYNQAHYLLPAKSTYTSSSQLVDHGSTYHAVVPSVSVVPAVKSTLTSNSQLVDHGSTYHAVVPAVSVVPAVKSTLTSNSQVVDHGSVVPASLYATPGAKSTLTQSSHLVNHGGHAVVHAPVVHAAPLVHATPVVHSHAVFPVQMSLVYSSPLLSYHRGDSAVSHQSSSVHETVPLLSVHH